MLERLGGRAQLGVICVAVEVGAGFLESMKTPKWRGLSAGPWGTPEREGAMARK